MMSLVWASDRLSFRPEWDTSQSLCCEYQKLFCWSEWDKSKSLLWDSVQARMGLESVFIVGIINCPTGQNGTGQSLYCGIVYRSERDLSQSLYCSHQRLLSYGSEWDTRQSLYCGYWRLSYRSERDMSKSVFWASEIVLQARMGHKSKTLLLA